ncbi:MAG TPA: hypothetical protein VNB86_06905 [Gaiellaceae bacterium]|jgi:hypothetical protein|nr:hypothetical protein [Gaiellaceae bacterium]
MAGRTCDLGRARRRGGGGGGGGGAGRPRPEASLTARGGGGDARRLLGDVRAWQVTLYMGLQSLVCYAGLAWLPSILRADGHRAGPAGTLLALYAVGGVPARLPCQCSPHARATSAGSRLP